MKSLHVYLSVLVCSLCFTVIARSTPLPKFDPPRVRPDTGGSGGLEVGPGGLVINGVLTANDPRDKARQAMFAKTHEIRLKQGKTYVIEMHSNQLDSYLRLEAPDGRQVAEDDDSAGFPNARIIYMAQQEGVFRVITTTFSANEVGVFTLRIQEK